MSSLRRRSGELYERRGRPVAPCLLAAAVLALAMLGCAGCGDTPHDPLAPSFGRGHQYRFAPAGAAVDAARPIAGLRCDRPAFGGAFGGASGGASGRFGVHLEVFANRRVVVIPAGVGVAPPRERRGAYVTAGRCQYPARTLEPTGVIEVKRGRELVLGQFFDLWGQPLSRVHLLGFRATPAGPVAAFVDGRPWRGDLRAIPLRRHAQIVLEVGGHFPPNTRYVFPPGL
jgi:hypothetical protein